MERCWVISVHILSDGVTEKTGPSVASLEVEPQGFWIRSQLSLPGPEFPGF